MKNIFLLTLIIPALSACGIIGTAIGVTTKAVSTVVDVVVENDTEEKTEQDSALAFTAE